MAIALPKLNRTKVYLLLDIALVLAFVVEMEEHFTGLRNHELIGIGLAAALLLHVILHWQWVVSITRTFFRHVLHGSRLNYLLNAALLVDFVVITITGIVISRTLGLNIEAGRGWEQVHILAAQLSLLLVGLHVAVHWKWIAAHASKYLFRLPLRKDAAPVTAAPRVQS